MKLPSDFPSAAGLRSPPRESKPSAIARSSHKLARLHLGDQLQFLQDQLAIEAVWMFVWGNLLTMVFAIVKNRAGPFISFP